MISRLSGQLVEKTDGAVIVNVNGLYYEINVPLSVLQRVDDNVDEKGNIELIIYHYIQVSPSSGFPVLVGFFSEVEREFFQQFIKVSGIGPRAAVKALNRSISQIAHAIAQGDHKFLKTLPGIGLQKAREIVAKLQSKVGKYGLIQDQAQGSVPRRDPHGAPHWQKEALGVLRQLQYSRQEAARMIHDALGRSKDIRTTEELLNEIYKQRVML